MVTPTPPPWLTGSSHPWTVATDSERALPWVESLARDLRLPVRVARAVPEEGLVLDFGPAKSTGELKDDETDAVLYLGATVVELRERGVGASPVLLRADPGTEVATQASVAQTVVYTSGAAGILVPARP